MAHTHSNSRTHSSSHTHTHTHTSLPRTHTHVFTHSLPSTPTHNALLCLTRLSKLLQVRVAYCLAAWKHTAELYTYPQQPKHTHTHMCACTHKDPPTQMHTNAHTHIHTQSNSVTMLNHAVCHVPRIIVRWLLMCAMFCVHTHTHTHCTHTRSNAHYSLLFHGQCKHCLRRRHWFIQ